MMGRVGGQVGGGGGGERGQGGCERRSEIIVKIKKKTKKTFRGGGVGRIRLVGGGVSGWM